MNPGDVVTGYDDNDGDNRFTPPEPVLGGGVDNLGVDGWEPGDSQAANYGRNLRNLVEKIREEFADVVEERYDAQSELMPLPVVWVDTQRLQFHEEEYEDVFGSMMEHFFYPDIIRSSQLRLAEYRFFDYDSGSKAVKNFDNSMDQLTGSSNDGFIGDDHPNEDKSYTIDRAILNDVTVKQGIGGSQMMNETAVVYLDDLPAKGDDEIHINTESALIAGERFAKAMAWLRDSNRTEPSAGTGDYLNTSEIYYHYGRFNGTIGDSAWAHYKTNFNDDVVAPDEWYIEVETLNNTSAPSFWVWDENHTTNIPLQTGSFYAMDFSTEEDERFESWYISLQGGSGGSDYSLRTYKVCDLMDEEYEVIEDERYEITDNIKWGRWKYYKITVPNVTPAITKMDISADIDGINDPEHNVDIFIREDEPAREDRFDEGAYSATDGSDESIYDIDVSQGEVWYIGVYGRSVGDSDFEDIPYTTPQEKEASGNDFTLRVTFSTQ